MTQNSIRNRCGSLLRNALRKGRSKKWSRGLPGASWGRFGSLRDAPGAPWEAPGELRSPSGRLPGAPRIVPGRPEAPQGQPRATLAQFSINLGSIWVIFARFLLRFVACSFVCLFVCSCGRSFVCSFLRPSFRSSFLRHAPAKPKWVSSGVVGFFGPLIPGFPCVLGCAIPAFFKSWF